MDCPVCFQPLIVIERANIELDYCILCKGVWFDSGELDLLLTTDAQSEENHSESNVQGIVVSESSRNCPRCSATMNKNVWDNVPELVLDRCPSGHGLWFDSGELERILSHKIVKLDLKDHKIIHFLHEAFSSSNNSMKE